MAWRKVGLSGAEAGVHSTIRTKGTQVVCVCHAAQRERGEARVVSDKLEWWNKAVIIAYFLLIVTSIH